MAAESYLVMEAHSGRVLLAVDPEKKRPVASLNYIATSKVVLDWAKVSQTGLSAMASVPQSALTFGAPNPMGLRAGDRISLRDALYSALLGSDNIAAQTLSDHVGRALLARRQHNGDPQNTWRRFNVKTPPLGTEKAPINGTYTDDTQTEKRIHGRMNGRLVGIDGQ